MKISAIQTNYFNKTAFRSSEKENENQNKNEDGKSFSVSNLDKNTKIAAGVVTAAVALAGLGYLGYHGKLGSKIQKLLGGAAKNADNIKGKDTPDVHPTDLKGEELKIKSQDDIKPKTSDEINEEPKIKPQDKEINPDEMEIKIDREQKHKKIIENNEDVTDAEIVAEPHKFATMEELEKLSDPEVSEKVFADIKVLEKESSSDDEAFEKIGQYFDKFEDSFVESRIDLLDSLIEFQITRYSKQIIEKGGKKAISDVKSALANIKLAKRDFNSAEKLSLEVLNDTNAEMSSKIDAFGTLRMTAQGQNSDKIRQSEEIFDRIIQKEISDLSALRNKPEEYDFKRKNLQKTFNELYDIYGKDNSTIKALIEEFREL